MILVRWLSRILVEVINRDIGLLILKEIEVSNVLIEQYNNLISKADALRLENKLEEAKVLYQKANDLNPSNPIAQEKIVLINESIDKINKENLKVEYDQLLKKADDFFSSKNYKKAREFYKKANRLRWKKRNYLHF